MREFLSFLIENINSTSEAMKFFGFTEKPDLETLKKTYKKLSLKYHPDLGGSEEQMKDLNQANDILKKYISSGSTTYGYSYKKPSGGYSSYGSGYNSNYQHKSQQSNYNSYQKDDYYKQKQKEWEEKWEKKKKEDQNRANEAYEALKRVTSKNLNKELYKKHFEDVFDEDFFVEFIIDPMNRFKYSDFKGTLSIKSKNGRIIASVIFLGDLVLLGGSKEKNNLTDEEMFNKVKLYSLDIIINNKTFKLFKSYSNLPRYSNIDLLKNPELFFPKKKLASIKSRAKSATKGDSSNKKLTPAALISVMENKYSAKIRKETASSFYIDVPLSIIRDEMGRDVLLSFRFYRGVFMKNAYIMPDYVSSKDINNKDKNVISYTRVKRADVGLYNITYDTLDFIEKTINAARMKKSEKEVAEFIIDEFKNRRMKEKNSY